MIILPAIDLKDGKCVRLQQGRVDAVTVYADDPLAQALSWVEQGAQELHVVDLDGAFSGQPRHLAAIEAIARGIAIPVEVGGGLRSDQDIENLLRAGATRAIIGTRAQASADELTALVQRFGAAIAVGIDARDGYVQIRGWVETTTMRAVDLAQIAAVAGVQTIIYTDTATDGMLQGTNVAAMHEMCLAVPQCRIIASGGVSTPADITALTDLGCANLYGAIVGKALYDGKTTLAALQAAIPQGGTPGCSRSRM